jgi:hypothetical protein
MKDNLLSAEAPAGLFQPISFAISGRTATINNFHFVQNTKGVMETKALDMLYIQTDLWISISCIYCNLRCYD